MDLLHGLVRVVARDGSVWWVRPDRVAFYAALDHAVIPASPAERAGSESYLRGIGK
jgi:hypothetical protein